MKEMQEADAYNPYSWFQVGGKEVSINGWYVEMLTSQASMGCHTYLGTRIRFRLITQRTWATALMV
jgi:hypothetical protein